MATVTITGNTVREATGRPDNRPWKLRAATYQDGGSGSVITPGEDYTLLRPVAGKLAFEAEAGIAVYLENPDQKRYLVTVPDADAGLWTVIEAGVAFLPDTSQQQLAAAVEPYVDEYLPGAVTPVIADAVDADLTSRSIGFVDEGGGEGHFTVGGVPISGTLVPPAATWSGTAGKPATVVYASAEEGLAANGVTNVSTALGTLINTLPAGSVLQLEAGDYYAPTLRNLTYNNDVTIRGVPGKTRILGDSTMTAANYAADVMIVMTSGSLRVENVTFEDTGIPVGFRDLRELGDITLVDCEFINCDGVISQIYDPTATATRIAGGFQQSFRNFRMSGCKIYGCQFGLMLNTLGGWESVIVSDSVFSDVGRVGVWAGYEYTPEADRSTFQPLQGRVIVHDNVFRDIHLTDYTISNPGANAVLAMGQAVTIHDNIIENVYNEDVWDDCEAIYTKARYFDIHDNVLVDAGGFEAAIMLKGVSWEASTTLDSSMNGLTLPQSTLTVASTEGFGPPNPATRLLIETSLGWQTIAWTGKTATTITGVTGGTGTLSTGGVVRGEASDVGALTGISNPGKVHDNLIVFTRTDVAQRGVVAYVSGISVTDNVIVGATGSAIAMYGWSTIERNIIRDHHGAQGILLGGNAGSSFIVRNNKLVNFDGTYLNPSSMSAIWVQAVDFPLHDILIEGNVIRNELAATGLRSAASAKFRAIQVTATGTGVVSDLTIRNNRGRNLNIAISIASGGSVTNVKDIDNDWVNEDGGAAPTNSTSNATNVATRTMPAYGALPAPGRTVSTITGSSTLGSSGDYVIFIGSGGAPTLPTAVGNTGSYLLKNIHSATRSVATTSSQTIEGTTPYVLPAGASIEARSDGTNWRIV